MSDGFIVRHVEHLEVYAGGFLFSTFSVFFGVHQKTFRLALEQSKKNTRLKQAIPLHRAWSLDALQVWIRCGESLYSATLPSKFKTGSPCLIRSWFGLLNPYP